MDRLTAKTLSGVPDIQFSCFPHPSDLMCAYAELYAKLCAYEDTGLMPEEIGKRSVCKVCPIPEGVTDEDVSHALELLAADNDGRCVVTTCKVGDMVWLTDDCMEEFTPWSLEFDYWMLPQFGKTVFLTREEAEAAMKEGAEDDCLI